MASINAYINFLGDCEEADNFFSQLSDGGAVIMPMNQTFWESYFGMCTDKFDINLMISFGQSMEK